MKKPLIELNNLSKSYKTSSKKLWGKSSIVKAVQNVSLQLYSGESFGLVGESGCGKSTTGQLLMQLIKPTNGKVFYKGEDVSQFSAKRLKAWRKEVQIVFQDPYSSLNPAKTIEWIINEPLEIHKIGSVDERKKKVLQTLEDVGLDSSYLKRKPHELSGGQRQRVAIASALILKPEFIVIDEGVSALDVSVQAQILNLLKELQGKYKITYFFISHDLNVVRYFCDRIAVMYLGEIVEIMYTDEMGRLPEHPYAQALFSSIPHVDNSSTEALVLKGELPSPSNPPTGCSFHTRCPFVKEICKSEKPKMQMISDSHEVSCHLKGEMTYQSRSAV